MNILILETKFKLLNKYFIRKILLFISIIIFIIISICSYSLKNINKIKIK